MKIIRFVDVAGGLGLGAIEDGGVVRRLQGELFGELLTTEEVVDVARTLAPIEPVDIFCIGLNYAAHAEETGAKRPRFPVLFMKSTGALNHPGDPIVLPRVVRSDKVDYEGELAVVIGRECKNASRDDALRYVAGYTCANDVSARDWQKEWGGGQFCRGKTFDTFAPLGPCLVTPEELPDPNALRIKTTLNGSVVQDSSTSDMIFDVPTLIEFLSGNTTLRPGTVILTGTPPGVGMARKPPCFLKGGDVVTVEIEGIGELMNLVEE